MTMCAARFLSRCVALLYIVVSIPVEVEARIHAPSLRIASVAAEVVGNGEGAHSQNNGLSYFSSPGSVLTTIAPLTTLPSTPSSEALGALSPTSTPTFAPQSPEPPWAQPAAATPTSLPRGPSSQESAPVAVAAGKPTGSTASPALGAPKVFFLFMVYAKINNEKVWQRFFLPAVRGTDYHALVHCKFESSCKGNVKAQHIFEIIPTVETTYCFDLVNAMNTLLQTALARGGAGHPNDKFVFISDSTLPIKPFAAVRQRLTVDSGATSDFCVFPRNEWAEVPDSGTMYLGQKRVHAAVKHHQWVTLSRAHALEAIKRRDTNFDLMTRFQLNSGGGNSGCLDEFWLFATLFGTLNLTTSAPASFQLKDYTGGPLTSMNHQVQGQCDTFVHWMPRAEGTANNLTLLAQFMKADAGTDMQQAGDTKPATIGRLSKASLEIMRDSWFLFARKVEDAAPFSGCESLEDAFDALIFASPPRPLPSLPQAWLGQGAWLDNRNSPVTISSSEGSLRLLGAAGDLDARGGYCGSRMDVAFTSTYKTSATLSADAQQLAWSNGVIWHRSSQPVS